MEQLELLAPAKHLEMAKLAINHGADAVYMGCSDFGARHNASNSIADVAEAVIYAHRYHAKVYVTLNTILFDNELEYARTMAYQLYNAGVDALLIQDMSLLQMDMPPIALHASTQMNNVDVEKIRQYKNWGISRVVLARELSLKEIENIYQNCDIELECFVHGALCVCYSGQCYMSYHIGQRSANRGVCAQPCRLKYVLKDETGKEILKPQHYLSLKDMNRFNYLADMAKAGVRSFKIEGRLKDESYVANVVSAYRQQLDKVIEDNAEYGHASLGTCTFGFLPDLEKTFNRGYTNYFITGERQKTANHSTPKSIGKYLGVVNELHHGGFRINTNEIIVNGDGLCWQDSTGEWVGMNVNAVDGKWIKCTDWTDISLGTKVYRNYDKQFFSLLKTEKTIRKIAVCLQIKEKDEKIVLQLVDEQGNTSQIITPIPSDLAKNQDLAIKNMQTQLAKSGDAIFNVQSVKIALQQVYFFTMSQLNAMRRQLFEQHEKKLLDIYQCPPPAERKTEKFYLDELDYHYNVSNHLAKAFYEKVGAKVLEFAPEYSQKTSGKEVMRTKYCLRNELNACLKKQGAGQLPSKLVLSYEEKDFAVTFDCVHCQMILTPMEK